MLKKYLYGAAKCAAVFVILLLFLWGLLVLSVLIPNDAISDNMGRSAVSYKERDAFAFTSGDKYNSISDNYADSIWLNIAWNMGKKNPLIASVDTDYYDGEELGENAGLYYTVTEGALPNKDYTRYWHGTTAFIRFFHLFTDVDGIKIIGFSTFLLLVTLTVFILAKENHTDLAVVLILALSAVQIWNIRLSIEYQPAFIIAFILIPLYLFFERKGDKTLTLLSVAGGTSVAFFDFLTTETVTLLLPLAIVTAVRAKENRFGTAKMNLILLLKCGMCWAFSYIGTFIAKWMSASVLTGENAFEAALSSAAERMGTELGTANGEISPVVSSVFANLNMLFGGTKRVQVGQTVIGVVVFIVILLSIWYLFRKKETHPIAAFILLAICFVVILRYLVLNNHSYLHCFFTYRSLVTAFFAMVSAMWLNISFFQKKRRQK